MAPDPKLDSLFDPPVPTEAAAVGTGTTRTVATPPIIKEADTRRGALVQGMHSHRVRARSPNPKLKEAQVPRRHITESRKLRKDSIYVYKPIIYPKSSFKKYDSGHSGCLRTGARHDACSSSTTPISSPHSRTAGKMHAELEKDHHRPLGPSDYSRVSNRLVVRTGPGRANKSTEAPATTSRAAVPGAGCPPRKRGDIGSGGISTLFPIPYLPGPKERWLAKASNQPEGTEQIRGSRIFQDGTRPTSERATPRRRLASKDGPKRRLFCSTNQCGSQEVSVFPVGGKNLSVQLPSFWVGLSPKSVYQDNEASCGMAETTRCENHHLHRRQSFDGTLQGGGGDTGKTDGMLVRVSGVHNQFQKVQPSTFSGDRIFGIQDKFSENAGSSSSRENGEHTSPGLQTASSKLHLPKGASPLHWEGIVHDLYPATSSPILQEPPGSPEPVQERTPGLGLSSSTPQYSQRGAPLVGHAGPALEQQRPEAPTSSIEDPNRCLVNRLGCSVQQQQDRGTLDSPRVHLPHQLPGASSSLSGYKDLCKGSGGYSDRPSNGQHVSVDIHQQERRHPVPITDNPGKRMLDVVHGQKDNTHSTALTRETKRHCRRGIPDNQGSLGLDAESSHFPSDTVSSGADGHRPVCIKDNSPTSSLLQLEARPSCLSHRCLQPAMGSKPLLCQSSLVSDHQSGSGGQESTGLDYPHSTSMEISGLVSNNPGPPDGLPPPHPTRPISDNTGTPLPPPNAGRQSAVGRMAYIRQSCSSGQLSEKAAELLMASWRSKSHSNYNSLFCKWERWCTSRERNPISGPINDVVNFIAELFQEGYSYSSLNSYRSAISSVHQKVDGYLVGQHPLVARVLKGAFNERPPKPRYSQTWKVSQVTKWLENKDNTSISILSLSCKTVVLMSLARPCRTADLAGMDRTSLRISPEGASMHSKTLAKQCRPGKNRKDFFFPTLTANSKICPVKALEVYLARTASLRGDLVEEAMHLIHY